MKTEKININIIKVDWTAEADDILVKSDSIGYQYKSIFGDINIWDNVIKGSKNSSTTAVRYGIRTILFEILDLSFGYYDNSKYNFTVSTEKTFGVSVGLKGLFKIYHPYDDNKIMKFTYNHINIQYHYVQSRIAQEYFFSDAKPVPWLQKYGSLSLTVYGL